MTAQGRTHYRSCPFCEAGCGVEVTADHDSREIVHVRGDAADPFSRGFVCAKSYGMTALHSDPDRLRQPLLKRGGDFEEIGWEQAMDIAAERIGDLQRRYGQHSVGYYFGNPSGHKAPFILYGGLLIETIGSMQVYSPGTLDQIPKFVSATLMFGGPTIQPIADLDRTSQLIIIGSNPVVSQGSMIVAPGIKRRIEGIRKRGGKVVVIDPRHTETAAIADQYIPIRPGTDAYLLFAMVHVIARENLVELGAVAGKTRGLDQVLALAAQFPPERIAAITGIPQESIIQLAGDFARAPAAAMYGRTGTCTQRFGSITSWLIDVLNIVSGNLDRVGGNLFSGGGIPMPLLFNDNCKDGVVPIGRWHSRVNKLPEAFGMLPTAALADEILSPGDGQVRGFVTQAGNLMLSNPNGGKLQRAFESLEFMLSFDIYLNETTRHADLIIPGPSYVEHSDFAAVTAYEMIRKYVKWAPPVFPPEPGTPHDWEIFAGIAARLQGKSVEELEEQYMNSLLNRALNEGRPEARTVDYQQARAAIGDSSGPDRLFDIMIRGGPHGDAFGAVPDGLNLEKLKQHPHGLDLGPLDAGMVPDVLLTPDKLIDLAPALLVEDVPRLEAALGEQCSSNTLLMIGRRDHRSKNAWMHNIRLLVKGRERCTLLINPSDAERRQLTTGSRARISTQIGEVEALVEISDEVMPGVVSLPHGWGHDQPDTRQRVANAHPGTNANAIIDELQLDVPSASTVLNGVPVEIERIL
jgi:anaerobic selenocysteine-containing dehydrogenase